MKHFFVVALLLVVASLSVVHSHKGPSIVYFPESKQCAAAHKAIHHARVCSRPNGEVCGFKCSDSGKLKFDCDVKAKKAKVPCDDIYCHRHDLDELRSEAQAESDPSSEAQAEPVGPVTRGPVTRGLNGS